jgi:hypothetical protein
MPQQRAQNHPTRVEPHETMGGFDQHRAELQIAHLDQACIGLTPAVFPGRWGGEPFRRSVPGRVFVCPSACQHPTLQAHRREERHKGQGLVLTGSSSGIISVDFV